MAYPILQTNSQNPLPFTWVIKNPGVGGVAGCRLVTDLTVTKVDSYVVDGTSATFNIEERSTIGSAGTNIMASDLVSTTTGVSQGSFSSADLSAGNWLWVDISAVSGSVSQLVITLSY